MRYRLYFGNETIPKSAGLMSYASDTLDAYQQSRRIRWPNPQGREARQNAGIAVDRFELVINNQTAKTLGITVPPTCRPRRRGDRMKRRQFLTTAGASAIALVFLQNASAQGSQVRIGLLASVAPTPAYLSAFRDGMRERGYVEGQNLIIEVRWPQRSFEQDPGVAAEFVRANVNVVVAWGTQAVAAARSATATIPIVMVSVSDPVGAGFVASLARPGGNVTGVTPINPDISGKLVELLREIVPGMKQVGVVFNPKNPGATAQMRGTEDAARGFGLQSRVVEARALEEFSAHSHI